MDSKHAVRNRLHIDNRDYWVKVVGMLQQNWALIQQETDNVSVFFLNDLGAVFDQLTFDCSDDAVEALKRNGFFKYSDDKKAQQFVAVPKEPISIEDPTGGKIYSSGEFWA